NAEQGVSTAFIPMSEPKIAMDPEATLVADNDLYGLWAADTEQALGWTVGTEAGNIITFAMPAAQIMDASDAERKGLQVDQVNLQLNSDATDGDEWSIVFS